MSSPYCIGGCKRFFLKMYIDVENIGDIFNIILAISSFILLADKHIEESGEGIHRGRKRV